MAKFPSCKCVPAVCNVSTWDSCNALYELGYKPKDFIENEILNLAEFCLKLKRNNEH